MRFFWRLGEVPTGSRFPQLNAEPVIRKCLYKSVYLAHEACPPCFTFSARRDAVAAAFPEWKETMNGWGSRLLGALTVVADMVAIGLGLPVDSLSSRMRMAPHLLAPTVRASGDPLSSRSQRVCVCVLLCIGQCRHPTCRALARRARCWRATITTSMPVSFDGSALCATVGIDNLLLCSDHPRPLAIPWCVGWMVGDA